MQAERSRLAANHDGVAQAEAGDAEQFVQIGKQNIGLHALGTGRRRHGAKLDVSERGAQERVAHGLVPGRAL